MGKQEKLQKIQELHDSVLKDLKIANIPLASYHLQPGPETFGKELFGGLEQIRYRKVMFKSDQSAPSEVQLLVEVGWTDKAGDEQFNRTLQDECLDGGNMHDDSAVFNRCLTEWLVKYNLHRPYAALNYQTLVGYLKVLPTYSSCTKQRLVNSL